MAVIIEPGSYRMSNDEYHADPAPVPSLSAGVLSDLWFKTPHHAWFNHPRLNPAHQEKDDGKFDIGNAGHALLLEGEDRCAVIDADDWRTKVAKEARDAAYAEGKTPLLREQYDRTKVMVDIARLALARSELGIKDLLAEGDSELSYFWREGGTWMRIRPDWISRDRRVQINAKFTAHPGGPSQFSRMIENMGYDLSAAFYRRGIMRVDGPIVHDYYLFVIETTPPHECYLIGFPPPYIEMGQGKVEFGVNKWRECMANGEWPGYANRIYYPDPTPWGLSAWENRTSEEAI